MVKINPSQLIEYEDAWGTASGFDKWTVNAGTNRLTKDKGVVAALTIGGGTGTTTAKSIDLRGYTKLQFHVNCTGRASAGGGDSGSGVGSIILSDDGSNNTTLVSADAQAGSAGSSVSSAAGYITLYFVGGKVLVRIVQTADEGLYTVGSTTRTFIADNTLVDTSSWSKVIIKLVATEGGTSGGGYATVKITPILQYKTYIGSNRTQI